jgi:hypothetical protein
MRLSVMCLAATVVMSGGMAANGAVQWSGNGHWYEAVSVLEGITWPDARDAAIARGGYLASMTSAEENQFAFSLVNPTYFYVWLGGYQDHNSPDYSEPAGGWTWLSGETWSYTNWDPRWPEPNNGDGGWEDWGDQDCLSFTDGGTWDDGWANGAWTSGAFGYVVEYNSQPTPEPSTIIIWSLLGGISIVVARRRRRAD